MSDFAAVRADIEAQLSVIKQVSRQAQDFYDQLTAKLDSEDDFASEREYVCEQQNLLERCGEQSQQIEFGIEAQRYAAIGVGKMRSMARAAPFTLRQKLEFEAGAWAEAVSDLGVHLQKMRAGIRSLQLHYAQVCDKFA